MSEMIVPMESPIISVIVINYNTREMTLHCLRTLEMALEGLNSEIIVVDNASTDGSVAAIKDLFPGVTLVANLENAGFGAANNQAMRVAGGSYFLLLNSDAFPEKTAVSTLVDFMEMNKGVGVAGPRILNEDGSLQISCHPFPSPVSAWLENLWLSSGYRHWKHDRVKHIDFVIGACMLVRREAYQDVGGFDERFFMYSEEADLQRRMKHAGWEIVFVPEARVKHLGGASGAKESARINRHFFESLDYYERKHHGLVGLISLRAAMAVGCALRAVLWTLAAIVPGCRPQALAKARKHSWLFLRQTTHWTLGTGRDSK
jgi:hypothetical protein